ncbi:hypothetical protein ACH4E8_09345 [Streptomyces sp. NPDC017979]|uniref:hypothetical protein n=1 Tax=Streptomyces sp. NPDC017979 TaxID=3365024 RepID=UPI0037BD4F79
MKAFVKASLMTAALAVASMVMSTTPASAAIVPAWGDLTKNRWTTYSWQHYANGQVRIRKDDGPAMSARMVYCNSGGQIGVIANLRNEDPTGWYNLGNFQGQFCLSVMGRGNNTLDTWGGYLEY